MQKRMTALLAALLVCLVILPVPVGGEEHVYFTAANDYIQPISDATMPFWSGNTLYVDSALFRQIGINRSWNPMKKTLVLSFDGSSLVFDLANDTTKDGQGYAFLNKAVQKGDVIFVPVLMTASYFRAAYSYTKVDRGHLVWIRNNGTSLSPEQFANAATQPMETRYNDYLKSLTADEPSASLGPPAAAARGRKIYLCMEVADLTAAETLLAPLESGEMHAAFYWPETLLGEGGDLLRRMLAGNQSIGLIADAADGSRTVTEQLSAGNEALWAAACRKTRLAYLRNSTDAAVAEAQAAGYRVLVPDLDREAYGLSTSGGAGALLDRVVKRQSGGSVWLGSGVEPAGLRAFLNAARAGEHRCLGLTETTA